MTDLETHKRLKMTSIEYQIYWLPACANLKCFSSELESLLKVSVNLLWYVEQQHDVLISEEAKTLLIKLAGPHGKTLLRAYRARKGWDT